MQVNKRGKVSSRPGPGWQPEQDDLAAAQQQQQQEQPAAAVVTSSTPPAAAPQQQQQSVPQPQSQPQRGSQLTETPQVVVDRMFKRVITFAGLPVVTGMLLIPVFWYLRVRHTAGLPRLSHTAPAQGDAPTLTALLPQPSAQGPRTTLCIAQSCCCPNPSV
jgi:hypothetical protein